MVCIRISIQATREVLTKEAPGLAIAMITGSLAITPLAMLSRYIYKHTDHLYSTANIIIIVGNFCFRNFADFCFLNTNFTFHNVLRNVPPSKVPF